MFKPGKRTYTAAAIAVASAALGLVGLLSAEGQQFALHMAVGLGLFGLRQAIARIQPITIHEFTE